MRGNRSEAVTTTRGWGGGRDGREKCREGGNVFMPKSETWGRQMLDYAWEMVHG